MRWMLTPLRRYADFTGLSQRICIEGTRGPNRFGDNPKGENAALVFE
ncbi:MAG: hypothetical protein ABJK87_08650 [Marinomonas sp.]